MVEDERATAAPKQIAILGGGIGGLAAAYGLLANAAKGHEPHITIFESAPAPGGKGASFRAQDQHRRIEEHGLHEWFGFYDNAFTMLRRVYADLRDELQLDYAVENAFTNHSTLGFVELYQGKWTPFTVEIPVMEGEPGDGTAPENEWHHAWRLFDVVEQIWGSLRERLEHPLGVNDVEQYQLAIGEIDEVMEGVRIASVIARVAGSTDLPGWLPDGPGHPLLVVFAESVRAAISDSTRGLAPHGKAAFEVRKIEIALDYVLTNLIGLLKDEVLQPGGFLAINHMDYRAWLLSHGLRKDFAHSYAVNAAYDSSFAVTGTSNPAVDRQWFEAGTVLKGALRMFFWQKGAVIQRFRWATAEAVVAPLEKWLRTRKDAHGHPRVTFEFGSTVTQVEVAEAKKGVGTITRFHVSTMPTSADPMTTWPTTLPAEPSEAVTTKPPPFYYPRPTLLSGKEKLATHEVGERHRFHHVVLAMPVRVLESVCSPNSDLDWAKVAGWRTMLHHVKSTPTVALQLWLKESLHGLGWGNGSVVLSTFDDEKDPHGHDNGYKNGFNTWADLTLLRDVEQWEPGAVGSIAYFCGVPALADPDPAHPGKPVPYQPLDEQVAYLKASKLQALWPKAYDHHNTFIVKPVDEYARLNMSPSEQYVLSVPDSTRHRIHSSCPVLTNATLAGDWTRNGLDSGCMEAAVMSGLQAARAILGTDFPISGEDDATLPWPAPRAHASPDDPLI